MRSAPYCRRSSCVGLLLDVGFEVRNKFYCLGRKRAIEAARTVFPRLKIQVCRILISFIYGILLLRETLATPTLSSKKSWHYLSMLDHSTLFYGKSLHIFCLELHYRDLYI
jgi:hypothetical protein